MTRFAAVLLLAPLAAGCLSYSPHELPARGSLREDSLARLAAREPAEPLRFAVLGDVHLSYDELAIAVDRLNRLEDLAFVVQLGDFSDWGRASEFELAAGILDGLRPPWFAVVGNHDLLGNGGRIFDALLGPRDHAFTYARTRFVFLDTNSREYGFGAGVPDLGWLGEQVAPGDDHDRAVVFSHVPPWSGDFDPALRPAFQRTLAGAGVAASFHGHDHHFRTAEVYGVPYFVADGLAGRSLLVVEQAGDGTFGVQRVTF